MHLAIVSPFPPTTTGIGQYGYHLGRALARSQAFDRITLLTARTEENLPSRPLDGIRIERVWTPERIDAGLRVVSRLRSLRPDVVWYNLGSTAFGRSPFANFSGILSPGLTRSLGLVTVVTIHEMAEWADLAALGFPNDPLMALGTRLVTRLLTRADLVCTTLRCHAQWLAARRPGLHWIHIPIGAYGVAERLPPSGSRDLLVFTSIAPYKGLELLLETFPRLKARFPDLTLTVAGTEHGRFPGYFEKIKKLCAGLDGVRWLGCVPEERVRELFQRAMIVVLPYTATTGSSSVLFQAARWGRPVVCSDLPELRAAAGESGLEVEFFKSSDASGLAAALVSLLTEPARGEAMVANNMLAAARVKLEDTCDAYLRAFNRALALRQSPKRIAVPEALGQETGP